MKTRYIVLILIGASILTHFLFFGYPKETVFDEVHFGKFISGYFTHQYFFDIHPPLGKLIISAMGRLTGFKPGFSFSEIGETFPDSHYLWLRLLPTVAGTLLPLVIFFLALRLGLSRMASAFAAVMVILDNALTVQSRFILLDLFLLLFGFLSLLLYLKYLQENSRINLYGAGILAALAVSVKWTGLSFLGIIIIFELIGLLKKKINIKHSVLAIVVVPFLIYFGVFAIHLELLTNSGPGDAFMSQAFQKTLAGNPYESDQSLSAPNIFSKFIELNKIMYTANQGLTATHPYSSKWYTWPFMLRPIFYWQEHVNSNQDLPLGADYKIYFLGNPIVWWASTAGIIYLIIDLIFDQFGKKKQYKGWILIIPLAYVVNMLPFIGIKRVMFLYHYMIGFVFAILALAFVLDRLKNKKAIFGALIIASIAAFVYFAPLTYGKPYLTTEQFNHRAWLESWK